MGMGGRFLVGMADEGVQRACPLVRVWAGARSSGSRAEPGPYSKERPRYTGDSRLMPGSRRGLVGRELTAVLLPRVLRAALAHLSTGVLPAFAGVVPMEANLRKASANLVRRNLT